MIRKTPSGVNELTNPVTKIFKKADAILTGDWHLREDTPVCRTDNMEEAQWHKLGFISGLQIKHQCPVYHSGDLFHHWKPSPYLLSKIIEYIPKDFHTVYGNHDLPQHNLELLNKSGIHVLSMVHSISTLFGCHFGQTPNIEDHGINIKGRLMLVWHTMTYQAKEPYPGCTAPKAAKLLRTLPDYDLILTGDNHQPFVEEYEGRILVNPGCITRQTAAFADFNPRVYLYYADTNTVEPVFLPIANEVVSREHIAEIEQRDARIDAFVSKLSDEWEAGLSFEDNLKRFAEANEIRDSVMEIIYASIT